MYGFVNHPIEVKGTITLPVSLGDDEHTTKECVQFYVVDHLMTYRPIMRMEKIVIATYCIKIKFPISTSVCFLRSNQRTARQCHIFSMKHVKQPLIDKQSLPGKAINLDDLDVMEEHRDKKPKAAERRETL